MALDLTGDSGLAIVTQRGGGSPPPVPDASPAPSPASTPTVAQPTQQPAQSAAPGNAGASPIQYSPSEPSPAPTQPSRAIVEAMQRRGYDVGAAFQDDDSLLAVLNDVASRRGEIEQLEQLARYGQRYLSQAEQFELWQAQQRQQQQPAQPQQPEPKKPKWQAPEFDQSWMSRVKLDEQSGRYVPADMFTSPTLAEKVNEYMAWRQATGQRLVQDPFGVWREAGGEDYLREQFDSLRKEVREGILAELRQQQVQAQTQDWITENQAKFFAVGPNGALLTDPRTQEPVLSPLGVAMRRYSTEAREVFGLKSEEAILRYAQTQVERDERAGVFGTPTDVTAGQPQLPNAPQMTPEQRNDALKRQTVQSAARAASQVPAAPGRQAAQRNGGQVLEDADPTFSAMPQGQSFLKMALAEAAKQGLPLN